MFGLSSKGFGGDRATGRNVTVLAFCQALAMSGSSMVATMSALVGLELADDKSLATLPVAFQFTAMMLSTVFASLLMGRYGRRAGFIIGQIIGVAGGAVSVYAIFFADFWLFAFAGGLLGVHNAFWQHYRFAAADTAGIDYRARAISYVLAGGVLAAALGPQLSKWSVDWFQPVMFAGGYATLIILCVVTMVLLQFVDIPRPPRRQPGAYAGRPLLEIAGQPVFIVAVLASMCSYGVMTLVMTATPLAMRVHGFAFNDSATVIQWHVLAMFAPSFFTGSLIRRFGVTNVIIAGTLLITFCMAVNISGIDFTHFWLGLVLLGLGWNFMFIGGTTLVTEAYRPEEQARVQAMNDFLVFSTVAMASFGSGALQANFGWVAVNLGLALPMFIVFTAMVWFKAYVRSPKARI